MLVGLKNQTNGLDMKQIYAKNRKEWRQWLAANYDQAAGVWLVYYKKGSGKPSINYDASVEEALCFGWIDSIIKKLDDERYMRKFTPRRDGSQWSATNKKRVEKMQLQGLMTTAGTEKVKAAKRNGTWDNIEEKPRLTYEMLPEFAELLRRNRKARDTFDNLSETHKKQYLGWIEVAKRTETRERRMAESIRLLEQGKKLGLK